jgi:hypothetical protein
MQEYVAILGTLAGVLVGGLLNFLITKSVKHQEWRLALARDQLSKRQALYADFLAEIQRLTAQRIYRQLEIPKDVHDLDRLVAEMTLLSPDGVTDAARNLRRHLLRNSSASADAPADEPTFNQLNRAFLEVAKADLASYRGDA